MAADYSKWSLRKFAKHYVETLNTPAGPDGVHRSPIFGASNLILLSASVKFGQAAAQKVFRQEIKKADDLLAKKGGA